MGPGSITTPANTEPVENVVLRTPLGRFGNPDEIASGTTRATGEVKLDLKSSYGQLARIHLSGNGVVRGARAKA